MSNPQGAVADVTSKAVSRATFIKLLIFAFSLAFFPITSFFVSKNYFWNGDATYAAITAIVAANVVLVTYIFSAIREDREDQRSTTLDKKSQ